jgi:transposase
MPSRSGAVHVATTRRKYKGRIYETHLLRRTYREDGKVKHETLGNISHLPPDLIDTIRARLRGDLNPGTTAGFKILRTLPHGHVAAVLSTLRDIGLDKMIASRPSAQRSLIIAMIAQRIIKPGSKLATARALMEQTASSSIALELGIELHGERPLYEAMDWLVGRQVRIENKLAKKHLEEGSLILYDVSSSFYTGSHCPLAEFGYSRDGKKGYPQIVYGLLCNSQGCPVAIEVFEGNTCDPTTLTAQVEKIRRRFRIERVVLVGDRGMITTKRIDETLRDIDGLDWITALRSSSIKKLVEQGTIEPSLFDEQDLLEVNSPDYPGERLMVCRNPLLTEERRRKRQELLEATEKKLAVIVAATRRDRRPLKGQDKISLRIGKVINRHKVGKHFILEINEQSFTYRRDEQKIAEEAALDGFYVIRTSVSQAMFSAESTVRAYKDLSAVERAFRSLKTVDLKIRPIYHWLENRVRAHVFVCMLAYYVEWHMRQKLKTILFDDDDKASAELLRSSIVAPAQRSNRAKAKDQKKRTEDDLPVHSFQTLLADLATLAKNRVRTEGATPCEFYEVTQPTEVQRRAFELLGVSPWL